MPFSAASRSPVLVIKLSALGDVILSLGALAAIRRTHPDQKLHVLTTAAFADIFRQTGLVDVILIDQRPRWNPLGWWRLKRQLQAGGYGQIYDLHNNRRTDRYRRWLLPQADWSVSEDRAKQQHSFDRHATQLQQAGIAETPLPDLDFMISSNPDALPTGKLALLITGCSAEHPEKRWPSESYAELARHLAKTGLTPVLLGHLPEECTRNASIASALQADGLTVMNLSGHTSLGDLAELGRRAILAVGNDTGPTHLVAAAGCPTLALFTASGKPRIAHPVGPNTHFLQSDGPSANLAVRRVCSTLAETGLCQPPKILNH